MSRLRGLFFPAKEKEGQKVGGGCILEEYFTKYAFLMDILGLFVGMLNIKEWGL